LRSWRRYVDPELGFDPGSTKARLFEWLLEEGDVEPEVSAFVGSWRKCRKACPAFDECVALAVANAHDKRHRARSSEDGAEAVPKCEAVPCRTRAASKALDALERYSLDRNSPRTQVAGASAAVLGALNAVPSGRLFDAITGMYHHLKGAAEMATSNLDDPSVMLCLNGASQLLPALERALWEAGQLKERPPTRMTVTVGELLFPVLNFEKVLKLVETVEFAKALAAEVSPSRRGKRRGRPTFALLSQIRASLHQGGFSIGRIAWLVPDGPSETDEQREAAMQRVKHGLRARRGEESARKAS
jgi:hypothetical protein